MTKKTLILGSTGLVGGTLLRKYKQKFPDNNILSPSRSELNLSHWKETTDYLILNKPDIVFLCAAKVGGIKANNDRKAEFITDNIKIQTNVIEGCYMAGVKKLVFLGSSCIYPKNCTQPIKEEYLLSGYLEPTNDAYAIAKIAGIKMCQSYRQQYGCDFISVMPSNLYGIGDNFNLDSSHVLPALIRKFHEAKIENHRDVEIWGSGKPMREFLYADDLADALIFLGDNYSESEIINVGSGEDLSISLLAKLIQRIVGHKGNYYFNTEYPDGTMRKIMDSSKIFNLGWKPKYSLEEGLKETYDAFLKQYDSKIL